MCGICGNVVFSSLTFLEAAHLRVKAMLRSLSHRDPDATSQVDSDLAGFGAKRLVGAFAIAVWDSRSRCLTLVRDRTLERPLFYARNRNEIIFATEIAALVAHGSLPVSLDQEALRKYLQFGIFPAPDTPFAEIRKVAPGEVIQFDVGGMRREPYWRWQITESVKRPSSLDAFDQTFRTAVARQTDVEV